MGKLEEETKRQIKWHCINILEEAKLLEGIAKDPKRSFEDIETQAHEVTMDLGFLDEEIRKYRIKKDAQRGTTP